MESNLKTPTEFRPRQRVIVDAELGADELVDDLKDMDDAKTRDAVNRAKRRATSTASCATS